MWYARGRSGTASIDSEALDLLDSAARRLIIGVSFFYIVLPFLIADFSPRPLAVDFFVYSILIILPAGYLALRLLPHWTALLVWQAGYALAILVIVHGFQQPAFGFFLILLPFLSVITASWKANLLASGLTIGLVLFDALGPSPALAPFGPEILIGLGFSAAIGWFVIDLLHPVIYWSLERQQQAMDVIEKSRDERQEFKQIQRDLVLANQQLASLSDRLRAMHQKAEEGRQAKAEFVANVSHELRTPLNMIIGFSEVISQTPHLYGTDLPQALLVDIATIQRNSQHLAKLVDDVLDLSQVDAGRMALSKEWTDLPVILEEAIATVRPLFESKGLYLKAEIADDIPALYCDGTRIRQIVLNLLSNASRFTERGGIRVCVRRHEQELIVSVTDTGPGITPENQARLFEPFQQGDGSIRRRFGGSGLGLNISKRFVELHGGKMWLESALNVGTAFYFSLPLTLPDMAPPIESAVSRGFAAQYEPGARAEKSRAPKPAALSQFVVLEKGQSFCRWFERYVDGVEVTHVHSAAEAIQAVASVSARALIVNTATADDTGDDLRQLAATELPYGTPVFACSVPDEVEAAARLGIARYLVKPVTSRFLCSALASLGDAVESILLVDDAQEMLRLFSRILAAGPQRYRVIRATSGQRALALMRERRPDAVVLDLIMAGMDGFQVLAEMKRDPAIRGIPVIVVTSQNPTGEPIMSDSLTVSRRAGLSANDLVACIQAVSDILAGVQPIH